MQTMIETKDLTFAYPAEEGEEPRAALKDVNVSIERGSFVVVLGHTHCGLVQAAIDGHGDGVVREVAAEVAAVLGGETDPRVAERINVRHTISCLMENPTVRALAQSGQIEVVGAIYDMASGRVEWM